MIRRLFAQFPQERRLSRSRLAGDEQWPVGMHSKLLRQIVRQGLSACVHMWARLIHFQCKGTTNFGHMQGKSKIFDLDGCFLFRSFFLCAYLQHRINTAFTARLSETSAKQQHNNLTL